MLRRIRAGAAGLLMAAPLVAAATPAAAETPADTIRIAYLTQAVERPPALSNLDPPPADEGVQGARLGIADNATTGRFLGQRFVLEETVVPVDGDVGEAVRTLAGGGPRFIVANLPAATLDEALAEVPPEVLVLNAGAPDTRLRAADCRANLLHTLPSRAMLADALAQFLVAKRWNRWLLVTGLRPGDALYADALRRAAKRFGGRIVEDKAWAEKFDLRRAAQREIPLLTQGREHDVVLVADEIGDFGWYVPYNTSAPRPVAGTQGLVPTAWHWTLEAWGAVQLQNRFEEQAGRSMRARDYAAWMAVRAIGEAATRTGSTDPETLIAYLHGPAFELAAFKGRKLTFRPWNGQLRQPVPLVSPRALVSLSPQEGFLHPANDLDTLGLDQKESTCTLGE